MESATSNASKLSRAPEAPTRGRPQRIDVAILGTSPPLLIEGIMRARAGQRVVFFEGADQIGGAWQTTAFGGIEGVEAACHLIETYRSVGAFLTTELGVPMQPCIPAPLVREPGGRWERYDSRGRTLRRMAILAAKMGIVAGVRAMEALVGGRWRLPRTARFRMSVARRKMASLVRHPLWGEARRRVNEYPVGGAPAMLARFTTELEALGARFERGAVECLATLGADVRLRLADRRAFDARRVVVSESTSLRTVWLAGRKHEFETVPRQCRHLLLAVGGAEGRLCSYVHLVDDPKVLRASDVTEFARGVPPGVRVLVLEVTETAREAAPEALLAYLVAEGVLPRGLHIRSAEAQTLTVSGGNPELTATLRGAPGSAIEVLASRGDFALSIAKNRARWQELAVAARSPLVL